MQHPADDGTDDLLMDSRKAGLYHNPAFNLIGPGMDYLPGGWRGISGCLPVLWKRFLKVNH